MKLQSLLLGAALVFVGIPAAGSIAFYLTTQETFEATINQVNRSSSGGT